ncbi:hypothetical protein J5893_02950 [bacterium]|nr:hypothetical protein [bacterium]
MEVVLAVFTAFAAFVPHLTAALTAVPPIPKEKASSTAVHTPIHALIHLSFPSKSAPVIGLPVKAVTAS